MGRLKVLEGPEAALDISRKPSRQASLLASLREVGKNSRQQGKPGLPTGGCSARRLHTGCEHRAEGPFRKELLGDFECGWSPSTSSERSLRLCPISLQKGLWGCQFRIGHCFKINKGAKAIIYL